MNWKRLRLMTVWSSILLSVALGEPGDVHLTSPNRTVLTVMDRELEIQPVESLRRAESMSALSSRTQRKAKVHRRIVGIAGWMMNSGDDIPSPAANRRESSARRSGDVPESLMSDRN